MLSKLSRSHRACPVECHIELEMGEGHTPVVLGEKDDEAIMGVVTLEIRCLVFNPFKRTLSPMKELLI